MAILSKDFSLDGRRLYAFRDRDMLVDDKGEPVAADFLSGIPADKVCDVFVDTVTDCAVATLAKDTPDLESASFIPIRAYFASHPETRTGLASRLKALSSWRAGTKFCPVCGSRLVEHEEETAMVCPGCGATHYPRIEPCIIVLVLKGDEVLLLRHKHRNQDIYACLAGFVEAGETVEQALTREIREESGIEVDNIRYVGSQSWPFPDQLMLAYYADYKSGELKIQESEISEARWFPKDDIPAAPRPGSIAWRLIHFDF